MVGDQPFFYVNDDATLDIEHNLLGERTNRLLSLSEQRIGITVKVNVILKFQKT